MIEPLQKILNQQDFLEITQQELKRIYLYHDNLSLLIINFDHLEQIENEQFKQAQISQILQINLRSDDFFANLTQDNFVILLPFANTSAALKVAQRLYRILSGMSFMSNQNLIQPIIKIGIASYQETEHNIEIILERAREALMMAKNQNNSFYIVHPFDASKRVSISNSYIN
ncbi:diguanylate cyclase [Chroococcus sp. FPU101]|uniref:diguanylate cyclase n=1 Tax=Chroococcus sp. FPU101 TaxID=1974212 RepID=UPI001A8EDFD6|nr:diguanylate cyclase [Chroococcus sp. FPU101]GFE69790.1 hypothetical protein CFPU101_24000 [Chroococcus sp. FPU101]